MSSDKQQQEQPQGRTHLAAVSVVLLGVVIVTLDISLTSTAIPAVARGIGVSPASTIWIINIYYLGVVASMLPLAALGGRFTGTGGCS